MCYSLNSISQDISDFLNNLISSLDTNNSDEDPILIIY